MVRLNTTVITSYILFLLSAGILIFTFLATQNVKVLTDWKLTVPGQDIHVGDTVVIASEYTKLRDVTGKATRYIECQTNRKIYVRYPLNEAIANRASGTGGTGIVVKIPETIPDVPTKCKFTISIAYEVYPWKDVIHTNSSNEFMLKTKRDVPQVVGLTQTNVETGGVQTSQAQPLEPAQGQVVEDSSSSTNTTTTTQTKQSNNSQKTTTTSGNSPSIDTQTAAPEQPGIIDSILNAVGL